MLRQGVLFREICYATKKVWIWMDDWHDGWWEAGAVGRMTSQPAAVKLGFVCSSSHRQVYLAALCTWQSQTT